MSNNQPVFIYRENITPRHVINPPVSSKPKKAIEVKIKQGKVKKDS